MKEAASETLNEMLIRESQISQGDFCTEMKFHTSFNVDKASKEYFRGAFG